MARPSSEDWLPDLIFSILLCIWLPLTESTKTSLYRFHFQGTERPLCSRKPDGPILAIAVTSLCTICFPPDRPDPHHSGFVTLYPSLAPFFTPLFPVFFSDFFFSPSAASSSESSP